MKTAVSWLLAAGIAVAPGSALGCSVAKITGTWVVQVHERYWDEQYGGPPAEWRAECLFHIVKTDEKGVAAVTIRCDDEIQELFGSARSDFPELASDHELIRQPGSVLVAYDGTHLPAPNLCEWRLVDRADLDGAEYIVRFGALTGGKMRVLQLSGRGYQDHHFGSTEPKVTIGEGLLQ